MFALQSSLTCRSAVALRKKPKTQIVNIGNFIKISGQQMILFDLDHTLLRTNSSFRFGKYLYNQNFFSFWTLIKSLKNYFLHSLGILSIQQLHERSFDLIFRGKSVHVIHEHVVHFLTKEIQFLLNPKIWERLKEAQRLAKEVMILSSSPDFLVGAIANYLNIRQFRGTLYHYDNNFIFEHIGRVMDGIEKAKYVKDLMEQGKISLKNTTFYSDSHHDLPLLKLVGKAIVVKPNFYLKRLCLQYNWEILY